MLKAVLLSFLLFGALSAAPTYAQLSSLVTQVPPSGGFATVRLDKIDAMKNMELSENKEKLIIKEDGVYFFLAAGQMGSTSKAATGYIDFWFVRNGKQEANSGVRMTIDPSNTTGVLVSQTVLEMKAGDELSIGYSSSGPSMGFIFINPDNEPAIPSMIFTALKIDVAEAKK